MENNFFKWVTTPVSKEEVDIWFSVNNIIPERLELYSDFCFSLFNTINDTYLGDDEVSPTKIMLNEKDKLDHFNWCWNKVVDNFQKESLFFNKEGEHYDYFSSFYRDAYYLQKEKKVKDSIEVFLNELFNNRGTVTKSDLDMVTEIYKLLDKNLNNKTFT